MRYFNKKSKNNRGIVGITGALLVILGVGSLIFQSSTMVNVYAQVGVGPFIKIGPPNHSNGQNAGSDTSGDNFLAFKDAVAEKVYLAKIVGGQKQEDAPHLIIDGGTGPAVDVTPGGQVKVAAAKQGEIEFVGCADDDDKCTQSKIISNPGPTGPPGGIEGEGSSTVNSCRDKKDNDGDGKIDLADPDCKWASEGESTVHGLCSDGDDNDFDDDTDSEDQDCFHPNESSGGGGTAGTAGAERTRDTTGAERTRDTTGAERTRDTTGAEDNDTAGVEPTSFNLQPGTTTSSPQLTFVSTDGGDDSTATNPDIASSDNGVDVFAVWEEGNEIKLSASHDSGGTWKIVTVSNTPGDDTDPSVATSTENGKIIVHVAWLVNGDVFYARSEDGGVTFKPPEGMGNNLSNTSGDSIDYQLLTEGSKVYLVWVDKTNTSFGGEVYFKRSTDHGKHFDSTINLSQGIGQSFLASRNPDMAADGSKVAVTWAAYPERNAVRQGDILVRESLNDGGTFNKHSNAANTPQTNSKEPQVDYIPGTVDEIYVAFLDAGGPTRVNTATGTPNDPGAIYNVLATERDSSQKPFSKLVNLSDDPNNRIDGQINDQSNSQLELNHDFATWDPSGRRG